MKLAFFGFLCYIQLAVSSHDQAFRRGLGASTPAKLLGVGSHHAVWVVSGLPFFWGIGLRDFNSQTPVPTRIPLASVTDVSAGGRIACFVSNQAVYCMGYGYFGIPGSQSDSWGVPVAISSLSAGVDRVACGDAHACALLSTGGLRCWGNGGKGQLGNSATNVVNPSPVRLIAEYIFPFLF
jgi:hypothetical protein